MVVLSKFFNIFNPNMWIIGDLMPPFDLTTFISAIIFCTISICLLKRFSNDSTVPVRDSTKNHNWLPIKISSKVSDSVHQQTYTSIYRFNGFNQFISRLGIVRYVNRSC